jgi:hypothetical protein
MEYRYSAQSGTGVKTPADSKIMNTKFLFCSLSLCTFKILDMFSVEQMEMSIPMEYRYSAKSGTGRKTPADSKIMNTKSLFCRLSLCTIKILDMFSVKQIWKGRHYFCQVTKFCNGPSFRTTIPAIFLAALFKVKIRMEYLFLARELS